MWSNLPFAFPQWSQSLPKFITALSQRSPIGTNYPLYDSLSHSAGMSGNVRAALSEAYRRTFLNSGSPFASTWLNDSFSAWELPLFTVWNRLGGTWRWNKPFIPTTTSKNVDLGHLVGFEVKSHRPGFRDEFILGQVTWPLWDPEPQFFHIQNGLISASWDWYIVSGKQQIFNKW